jgi:diadenosine tetraphosphate (Ap4A) HIT family hydrolase
MINNKKQKIYFAPWRKKYYNSFTKKENDDPQSCVFCNKEEELLVLETKYSFIQANKYPYGGGHLLVIPKRHINTIIDLTTNERKDIFNLIDLAIYAIDVFMNPKGYNIGCSVGRIAGESINHLHFHVLPRFEGDVGWNMLCDFNVVSTSPEHLTKEIKKIIRTHKLKKKFDIL